MRMFKLTFFIVVGMLMSMLPVRAQVRDTMTFAVMGNSISTYYDYLPSGYAVYYSADREKKYGIQAGDTWWMQLSRVSGMTFLVNSSWSGSRVVSDGNGSNSPFVSTHRITSVGRNGVPDAILIAGGTNDWSVGVAPLGEYSTTVFNDSTTFRGAYTMLLHRLHTKYPNMKLICLSIFPRGNAFTDKNAKGWSMADANASIKQIAKQFGGYYVDCTGVAFSSNWYAYTLDKLHPTTAGHKLLADCISRSLITQKVFTSALKQKAEVDEAPALLDLQFDADGIVNKGTYETTVGSRGKATTLYDSQRGVYYGCTKVAATDYFYALYDEDSPLAQAFNNNVTWETLVRLDGEGNSEGNVSMSRFFSSEQDGGWSFYNTPLASTFSYTHKTGQKSIMKCLNGDSLMVSGKFYHLVVTMDRVSHTMRYFVNGKLVCTGTRCATDMPMPQCGVPKGKKNIWLALGGDPKAGSYLQGTENGAASTFVFARIYDGALTQKAAQALYNQQVKQFTEPDVPEGGLLMDCRFTPYGAQNMAARFGDNPIEMLGEPRIQFNEQLHCYEACFDRTSTNFFKYNLGIDPRIMNTLADAYSVEIYCKASEAVPSYVMRPVSCVSGFGFGLQMNTQGNVGYTVTTMGQKSNGSYTKTQWQWMGVGSLTDEYTHYVIVYDRQNNVARLFVNGEEKSSRPLTLQECNLWEWAPSEWMAIGGDAVGSFADATAVGNNSFNGNIVMARLWGKALNQSEAALLNEQIHQKEYTFTTGSNGYAAVCVPFMTRVPEGMTAYIVDDSSTTYAYILPVAEAGQVLPYGAAVILKGENKTQYTLHAIDCEVPSAEIADVSGNLLVGCFVAKDLKVGEGYYQNTTGNGLYRPSATKTIPAFSCYLPSKATRSILTYHESENTGIVGVINDNGQRTTDNGQMTTETYNLSGQRIGKSTPHYLYIKNGKKIIR